MKTLDNINCLLRSVTGSNGVEAYLVNDKFLGEHGHKVKRVDGEVKRYMPRGIYARTIGTILDINDVNLGDTQAETITELKIADVIEYNQLRKRLIKRFKDVVAPTSQYSGNLRFNGNIVNFDFEVPINASHKEIDVAMELAAQAMIGWECSCVKKEMPKKKIEIGPIAISNILQNTPNILTVIRDTLNFIQNDLGLEELKLGIFDYNHIQIIIKQIKLNVINIILQSAGKQITIKIEQKAMQYMASLIDVLGKNGIDVKVLRLLPAEIASEYLEFWLEEMVNY